MLDRAGTESGQRRGLRHAHIATAERFAGWAAAEQMSMQAEPRVGPPVLCKRGGDDMSMACVSMSVSRVKRITHLEEMGPGERRSFPDMLEERASHSDVLSLSTQSAAYRRGNLLE